MIGWAAVPWACRLPCTTNWLLPNKPPSLITCAGVDHEGRAWGHGHVAVQPVYDVREGSRSWCRRRSVPPSTLTPLT